MFDSEKKSTSSQLSRLFGPHQAVCLFILMLSMPQPPLVNNIHTQHFLNGGPSKRTLDLKPTDSEYRSQSNHFLVKKANLKLCAKSHLVNKRVGGNEDESRGDGEGGGGPRRSSGDSCERRGSAETCTASNFTAGLNFKPPSPICIHPPFKVGQAPPTPPTLTQNMCSCASA